MILKVKFLVTCHSELSLLFGVIKSPVLLIHAGAKCQDVLLEDTASQLEPAWFGTNFIGGAETVSRNCEV